MYTYKNLVCVGATSYRNPKKRWRKFSCDSQNQILYSTKALLNKSFIFRTFINMHYDASSFRTIQYCILRVLNSDCRKSRGSMFWLRPFTSPVQITQPVHCRHTEAHKREGVRYRKCRQITLFKCNTNRHGNLISLLFFLPMQAVTRAQN